MDALPKTIWACLASDRVAELIAGAAPGFVVDEDGHTLVFANAAGLRLLDADATAFGRPLAVDSRIADRIARFVAVARPGDTTRELLRLFDGLRAKLVTLDLARTGGERAVFVATFDAARAGPGDVAENLAALAGTDGLAVVFDASGDVLGAAGDMSRVDGLQDEIEALFEGADGSVVVNRLGPVGARRDVALVRLGRGPDAASLLHIAPAADEPAAPAAEAPVAEDLPVTAARDPAEPETRIDAPAPEAEAEAPVRAEAAAPRPAMPSPVRDDDDATGYDDAMLFLAPGFAFDEASEPEDAAAARTEEPAPITAATVPEAPLPASPAPSAETAPLDVAPLVPTIESGDAEQVVAAVAPAPADGPVAVAEAAAVEDEPEAVAEAVVIEAPRPTITTQDHAPDAPVTTAADAAPVPAEPPFVFHPLERPVKFVWQMDAERRFTLVSDEFAATVGPAAAAVVGAGWAEVAERFGLDEDGRIAAALARRDTWSGRTVLWPIEGEALRLPIDLAALPVFDRGRVFVGFRGFGTCRPEETVPDPTAIGLRLAHDAAETHSPGDVVVAHDTPTTPTTPAEPVEAAPETVEEPTAADGASIEADGLSVATPDEPADAAAPTPAPVAVPADGGASTDQPEIVAEPTDAAPAAPIEPAAPAAALAPTPTPTSDAAPEPEVAPPATTPADASSTGTADDPEVTGEPAEPTTVTEFPRDRLGALRTEDSVRLSQPERIAFRQIAEALGSRLDAAHPASEPAAPRAASAARSRRVAEPPAAAHDARLLERLPLAVAIVKDDDVVFANERFLKLLAYPDLDTFREEGGLDALFAGSHAARRFEATDAGRPVPLIDRDGIVVPVDAMIATVPWGDGSALMMTLTEFRTPETIAPVATPTAAAPVAVHHPAGLDPLVLQSRVTELEAVVDTATDGVLVLDADGLVLSANHGAEALFGTERSEMIGRPLVDRLAPESRRSVVDYLDGLARNGVASVLNDGREVIGAVQPDGLIPLFLTIGRISVAGTRRWCAVLRDITQWKKAEEDLTAARRRAEEASLHKSDFLAKISHEIRTPLNAIIGFSEVMMDERFGPVGSERYKDYLRDIHVSGTHIMSLVNDLLDLSKVEAGKMDLRFEAVGLADVVSECVAMMQPQANRNRIIIRTSLPAGVPAVVADPRSVRQVVLNLLSNAVKFTPAGGQVIVSTSLEDNGEVVMRVRDTGYGMTDKELETAMEPFRQLHTTRTRAGGTGLGLPLTKALVEANRAVFRIDSTVGQGTLATVAFPVTRVLAS